MGYSPMMQHYLSVKERYPDCIIFYRLGDFYEMFFDDAVKASGILGLTLTGRDCGQEERAPMCGVPYHAVDSYISKLIAAGEKVAICEQLEDPATAKGMVDRDVIRVVTAGTVTDDGSLTADSNNYIASVYKEGEVVALAWADITTGELSATEYIGKNSLKDALTQLVKLNVKEIICNDDALFATRDCVEVTKGVLPKLSSYPGFTFVYTTAEKVLLKQLNAASLEAFSVFGKKYAISAIGALLHYLQVTQMHALSNINGVNYVSVSDNMAFDSSAIKNLEIVKSLGEGKKFGSLLWLLDKTSTAMGARLLSNLIVAPLYNIDAINYRLDGVEELFNSTVVRAGLIDYLKQVKDIERLTGKISNNAVMPQDCLALAKSLLIIPSIKFRLTGFTSKVLNDISSNLHDLTPLAEKINAAITEKDTPTTLRDGGYIKSGYNAELDEFRNLRDSASKVILDMETRERDKTGIRTLKIRYNRVFGYYIEVSKSFRNMVPTAYQRRQTLVNAERFVTDELKELEDKILASTDSALKLEAKLYDELKDEMLGVINSLKCIATNIAKMDVLCSFAEVSKNNKYVRPLMVSSDKPMIIKDGRHPVVEKISKEKFVANDTLLDEGENRTLIITGPNMAGKSTYMRQNAIIVIMAHIGCFVPASLAQIPLIDRVFTRVGASDNLIYDQSTFMVEMIEVASVLQNATRNSLLILDEVGRGTSTYDGLSIAWAVIEYITQKIGAKTLFATHYHELLELENKIVGIKNYKIAVKEYNGKIVFLRKIMRGGANRSFGIEVASLAGVPAEVTERAKRILKAVESGQATFDVDSYSEEDVSVAEPTEVERILKELDVNNLSPMQALMIISDLKEKVK